MSLLAEIQARLKAPKGQRNKFGNYNYRSCEDIVEAVKPLLGNAYLVISDEMVQLGDRYYVKATAAIVDGDTHYTACAYAREPLSRKGMDEAQITGATSSYARKYALNGLLAIDDTRDADTTDNRDEGTEKNIGGTKVNKKEMDALADLAFEMVDSPDEEQAAKDARVMYEPLDNDSRQYLNGKINERKYENPSTGRQVSYWSAFAKLLKAAA